MSADLHPAAKCFGLWVGDRLAAFTGTLHMPHPRVRDITRISRTVTLPDWQGVGLNMQLVDALGAAYRAVGRRLRHYPAHPALVRTLDKSKNWQMTTSPCEVSPRNKDSTVGTGGRPCAVFQYCGPAMASRTQAERLIS